MEFLKKLIKTCGLGLAFALVLWAANTTMTSIALVNSTIDSTSIGFTTPAFGKFTSLADTALTSAQCVQAGSSGTLISTTTRCPSPIISVTLNQLGSDVTVPGSTLTTVDTQSIIMPSTGCPCRVLVAYNYFWSTPGSGVGTATSLDMYVTDGTNNMAVAQTLLGAQNIFGGISSTQMSPVTYGNGVNVTFTTKAENNASSSITIDQAAAVLGGSFSSSVQFTVMSSL